MPVTPGQIPVTPGAGKILDAAEVTVNATTVEREIISLGSPSTPANYAEVTAGNALQVDASATTQPVASDGVVDANNSTTATLGAGGTFTGTSTDMLPYASVSVMLISDQGGTITPEWSSDNVNWDVQSSVGYTANGAGTAEHFTFHRRARYFRIVYTNGATPQTFFRLQTIQQRIAMLLNNTNVSEQLDDDDVATLTRSVIVGHTTAAGGAYVNVKVNPSGTLTVDASNSTGLAASVTQGTTPWVVDGSGVTQPISVASLPLPTGAATDATLQAIASLEQYMTRLLEFQRMQVALLKTIQMQNLYAFGTVVDINPNEFMNENVVVS